MLAQPALVGSWTANFMSDAFVIVPKSPIGCILNVPHHTGTQINLNKAACVSNLGNMKVCPIIYHHIVNHNQIFRIACVAGWVANRRQAVVRLTIYFTLL